MANSRDTGPAPEHPRGTVDPSAPWPLRALMAVYRFLASLKLAVFSISTLAAVLAYGTWFESRHGGPAVQEYIYQGVGFSILLAFLAINILCAALIRFPWKKRQTGFVVTHAGLLILIFGSWWGFQYSDEGQAGSPEGGVISKLIRLHEPMIRVRPIDRQGKGDGEFEIPFKGGAFDWPAGRYQVITQPKDPFKIAVKAFYPAALPRRVHIPNERGGSPMLKLRPMVQPPGGAKMTDVFEDPDRRWFVIPARTMGHRTSKSAGPAKFGFVYVDHPEMVEDFLNPPKNPGTLGVARFRYAGKDGKPRSHEVRVDDAKTDVPIPLPDSDLIATFDMVDQKTTQNPSFVEMLGDTDLSVVKFKVRRGSGPEVVHGAFAAQPMIPPVLTAEDGKKAEEALLTIGYFRPPTLGGPGMAGTFGLIEVMGTPDGKLYYRVFGRDEAPTPPGQEKAARPGVLKGTPGPLELNKQVVAFGGNPNLPMTLAFSAEEYLPSGEDKVIYESVELPIGQRGNGLAAALLEMTVGDETKDVWVRRPPGLNPIFDPVRFAKGDYELAYDCDRKDLGFSLKLNDFDVGFDPGTSQASSFKSEVTLTDEAKGIKDKPITISMNQPFTHRELTFYQSSYERLRDPETGRETGDFQSVFQVGYDAGRFLKYLGCGLVVLGAFLQFYMRAGLFTDGGKAEREKAAEKARDLLERKAGLPSTPRPKPAKAKKLKNYDDATL